MAMTSKEQNNYLKAVLKSYRFDPNDKEVTFFSKRREVVIQEITQQLKPYLAGSVFQSGSMYKGTSINVGYDIDLIVPFNNQVKSLPAMKELLMPVLKRLMEKSFTLTELRDQKVSIGLRFKNLWGRQCAIDVVPGRALPKESYRKTSNLNLHFSSDGSYIKTNVRKQRKAITQSKGKAREIIRLLKIMKYHKGNQKPKSFMIELMVLEAFKSLKGDAPRGLAAQLEFVMKFIYRKLKTLQLVDPGNEDNPVFNLFSAKERESYKKLIGKALSSLQKGHDWLKAYFPVRTAE